MDCNSENYINCLSDDCLVSIYNKLGNASDRNTFGLTCQRWYKIRNIARRSLVFHSSDPKVYKEYAECLGNLLARSPSLNLISLAGCTWLSDSVIHQLKVSGSSLQSLSLYFCSGITDDGLAHMSIGCLNLVTLELYRCCNITDLGLESLSKGCRALMNLNLAYCKGISDQGIGAIIKNCPHIYALIITGCRGLTGTGFRGCPSTLTYLEAESCLLSPEGLSDAVRGGGLEYLNLHNLRNSIGLDVLGKVGDAKRLRFLNLRMCRYLSDDSVVAIARGCTFLEEWSLAVCHEVRLPGWSAIGLYCNSLEVLHVNRCRNLCDRGLQALRDGCMRLKVLHIQGCSRVTPNVLELFSIFKHNVERRVDEAMSIGPCIGDLFRWRGAETLVRDRQIQA